MSQENVAMIRTTVLDYLEGISSANAERIDKAFYSSVNLNSLDETGNLVLTPKDTLIAYATGSDIPENTGEILNVDVVGDMAFVKARIDLPEYQFFDFLTLLKLNTGWKIVSKTYITVHP